MHPSGGPPDDRPPALPVLEGRVEQRSGPRPAPPPGFDGDYEDAGPRTLRQKMFDIGWKGWLRLAGICLIVGVLLNLAQIDFFAPDFTVGGAIGRLVDGIFRGAGWLASRAWGPLLTGVIVVAPFWLLWRFASAWFRR